MGGQVKEYLASDMLQCLMLLKSTVLGILQGLTEFLPVSSSGHLLAGGHFFAISGPQIAFDVVLHSATALTVIIYYRRRLRELCRDLLDQRRAGRRLLPGSRFLLLLLKNKVCDGGRSAKLFEYMAARRQILALGPENKGLDRMVEDANAGRIEQYSQREMARKFAELLTSVT